MAIAEQQDAAERLIVWIQFGIVVTFGTLYAISPKTVNSGYCWINLFGLARLMPL